MDVADTQPPTDVVRQIKPDLDLILIRQATKHGRNQTTSMTAQMMQWVLQAESTASVIATAMISSGSGTQHGTETVLRHSCPASGDVLILLSR